MPDEVRALTAELHRTNRLLGQVLERLDAIEAETAELRAASRTDRWRAWWHRSVTALVVLLVAGLVFVAVDQRQQRIERCEAISEAFDAYTTALADFVSVGADATPEQTDRFEARVDVFRAEIQTRLADCT